jgi:ubiquinone/menaquinone biosynthesis C-methylase UbiE
MILRRITWAAVILLLLTAAVKRDVRWQRTDRIVSALAIEEGDEVAHVGPAGYLLPPLVRAVGEAGRVYALDWDESVVNGLRTRAEREGWRTLVPVVAAPHNPALPQKVDTVILLNVYRDIERREEFFTNLKRNLLPGARVVVIDFYRRPMKVGPPLKERVASHIAMREMESFGFRLAERFNVLPYQYFFVFKVRQR